MRTLITCAVVSVAIVIGSALGLAQRAARQDKPGPSATDATKQQIIDLERRWQRAVVTRDRSALDNLLAKDFSEEEWTRSHVEPGDNSVRVIKRQPYIDAVLKSDFRKYDISGDIVVTIKDPSQLGDPATATARLKLAVEPRPKLIPLSGSETQRGGYDVIDTWLKFPDGWRAYKRQAILAPRRLIPLSKQR